MQRKKKPENTIIVNNYQPFEMVGWAKHSVPNIMASLMYLMTMCFHQQ